MAEHDESAANALRRLVNGFQVSQAISVAATLGIADLVADGSRPSAELSAATASDPRALRRLLSTLAAVGVFFERDDDRFGLGPFGEHLRTDGQPSVAGWAAYIGSDAYWTAWGHLLHSVRTGENAFVAVHGVDPWQYRSTRPQVSALFDQAMASLTALVSKAVLTAYDFGGFGVVVDVGGGTGALLADILVSNPNVCGVLFDQPHVVSGAPALLAAAGVDTHCEVVGGSFFESVPDGGDAFPEYVALLERCGFGAVREVPTRGPVSVIEARPT